MQTNSQTFQTARPRSISKQSDGAARVRLAIAMGDPTGIGSEVVLKALADRALWANCDITLVGSVTGLDAAYRHLRGAVEASAIANPADFSVFDVSSEPESSALQWGIGDATSGEMSFRILEMAIAQTLAGKFDGIVTAPIAKSAWKAAGHHYPGQTELLAEMAGVERFGMMFVARSPHTQWQLRALLATTHIPLHQVPLVLTPDSLTLKLDLLIDALRDEFGITAPRIAIAGLNPHSGEQGQLGIEERDWLIPWLDEMRDRYPQAQLDGPFPPDTMWVAPGQAWFGNASPTAAHDAYLALYHDQGLIPVKLMAFDRAVNTTIGLPFIRTSPDHGTAFDIAGKGIADPRSMKAAIALAAELAQTRQQTQST
ncbi:MAG: 4-hydroxythreonine-4-phosphate dehydrogenase PdxA [Cyanobacteria bacterium J06638_22]